MSLAKKNIVILGVLSLFSSGSVWCAAKGAAKESAKVDFEQKEAARAGVSAAAPSPSAAAAPRVSAAALSPSAAAAAPSPSAAAAPRVSAWTMENRKALIAFFEGNKKLIPEDEIKLHDPFLATSFHQIDTAKPLSRDHVFGFVNCFHGVFTHYQNHHTRNIMGRVHTRATAVDPDQGPATYSTAAYYCRHVYPEVSRIMGVYRAMVNELFEKFAADGVIHKDSQYGVIKTSRKALGNIAFIRDSDGYIPTWVPKNTIIPFIQNINYMGEALFKNRTYTLAVHNDRVMDAPGFYVCRAEVGGISIRAPSFVGGLSLSQKDPIQVQMYGGDAQDMPFSVNNSWVSDPGTFPAASEIIPSGQDDTYFGFDQDPLDTLIFLSTLGDFGVDVLTSVAHKKKKNKKKTGGVAAAAAAMAASISGAAPADLTAAATSTAPSSATPAPAPAAATHATSAPTGEAPLVAASSASASSAAAVAVPPGSSVRGEADAKASAGVPKPLLLSIIEDGLKQKLAAEQERERGKEDASRAFDELMRQEARGTGNKSKKKDHRGKKKALVSVVVSPKKAAAPSPSMDISPMAIEQRYKELRHLAERSLSNVGMARLLASAREAIPGAKDFAEGKGLVVPSGAGSHDGSRGTTKHHGTFVLKRASKYDPITAKSILKEYIEWLLQGVQARTVASQK